MKTIVHMKLFLLIVIFLTVMFLNVSCKNSNIEGIWTVTVKYNELAKKEVIPEHSIFRFGNNNDFYINHEKLKAKYVKKGKIIRIKTKIKNRKYVIRGQILDKNTIKGEIKKIITDDEIASWIAKRKE